MFAARLQRFLPSPHTSRIARISARWLALALLATVVLWVAGFAVLLGVARRVHVDIPFGLAIKLPLLQYKPELIFAGESRTHYGVDPAVAAERLGKPNAYAVNIAYDAGEPLALLAAIREQPDAFRNAHVVVSTAPFIFNEGVKSAGVYPLDVFARLSLREQFAEFFPLRVGVMIRFIREAFNARRAERQDWARSGDMVDEYGVNRLTSVASAPSRPLSQHPHYAGWDLTGPKARFETAALCDIAGLTKKLTVVVPPWLVQQNADDRWRSYEAETVALLKRNGDRCGFDVLHIAEVPGLKVSDFADDMHVNTSGTPVYTRYLVDRLKL